MAHNGGPYYPAQTSGTGWHQPGYAGPPVNQGPQITPHNQNSPHQNVGPPSFTPQNQGPAYNQNQRPAYPQNQGPAYPQNQGPAYPQNQGPAYPQTQGPAYPQNQGPAYPSQNLVPQNQHSFITPQNQGPKFPSQDQGPCYTAQNQGSSLAPQNQGFPPHNSISQFHPQNQDSLCPSQNQGNSLPPQDPHIALNHAPVLPVRNQGPFGPPQNQGPPFPQNQNPCLPQNQGSQFPPQYQSQQFPPHNQGPRFPPQNQGAPFLNQAAMGPPQNQGPQFPLHIHVGPAHQQNQGPLSSPRNQAPVFPPQNQGFQCPQNQGPSYPLNQGPIYPQHQGHLGPQNQGSPYPQNLGPQNQGSLYPQNLGPQNQGPSYPQRQGPSGPQNQGPMCPILNPGPNQNRPPSFTPQTHGPVGLTQNQRPIFPPHNQGPQFSPGSLNNGSHFPQNIGSSHPPSDQGPAYQHSKNTGRYSGQQNDKWDSHPNDEEYSDSQYNNYEGDRSNENDDYEDDWSSNRAKKSAFKRCPPNAMRGRKRSHLKKDLTRNSSKEAPFTKRPRLCPNKNSYQSPIQLPKEKNSNIIQINIVNSSDMDCSILPKDSKLESKQSCHTSLESSKQCKKQEGVFTKSMQDKSNFQRTGNTGQNKDKQAVTTRKTNLDQPKGIGNVDSKAAQILPNNNFESELIKKDCTDSPVKEIKQNNVGNKASLEKCSSKSEGTEMQNKDKPTPTLYKCQNKEKETYLLKTTELVSESNTNAQIENKTPHTIENISTKSAKESNNESSQSADTKLNNASIGKLNNSSLQYANEKAAINNVKTKERIQTSKTRSSLALVKKKSSYNLDKSPKATNTCMNLRSSKRLNPQIDNVFDDNTSISGNKTKTCSRALGKKEDLSLSKVESNLRSKLDTWVKAKETILSDDCVSSSETKMDQTGIPLPKEEFKLAPKKELEINNEVNLNETKTLSQPKESTSDSNKITTSCTKVSQSTTLPNKHESVVQDGKENDNQVVLIKTEPDNSILKTEGVESRGIKNKVPNDASTNGMSKDTEILLQNNPTSSKICSILPDSTGSVNSTGLKSNCSASTSDETSQNSDLEDNCQSLNDDSQNGSDLSDGINPLEANLREFDILDQVEGSEDEEGDQSTVSSEETDSEASGQEGLDEEDIDAMLEEGLPANQKSTENKAAKKVRHKFILEEIGHNHFDLLPEGWIPIMHNSGMPVYLHQKTRVCTMSRPYFLGPGSARSHKTPLSAIPCLQYKRALEIEKKYEEENQGKQTTNSDPTDENRPPLLPAISAKIETAEENEAAQSLNPTELQEYCKKVFNFKTISIIPFKSWGDRRKFARMTKDLKKQQRPLLPSGTKLLKFPIHNPDGTVSKSKGEWVINPNGKTYVCILHEYVQHALKQHPRYQFKELKNPATPYSATVYIGEMQYGTGMGGSKKYAKLEAAKAALEVLIPEMKEKIGRDSDFGMHSGIVKKTQNYENSIFDQIQIEDPRVAEFCAKTTEPPPYAILATCLQRNGMGLDEVKVEYNMNPKRHKEDKFKMTVGNHTATVMCKNKRDGKQKAAQAILKALHPNIEHFGSLLRMYGNHSVKSVKEKKREEQEITGLQSKAAVNQPNYAILRKLREEMHKLAEKRKNQESKGKFLCDTLLPTASTADLNKINL